MEGSLFGKIRVSKMQLNSLELQRPDSPRLLVRLGSNFTRITTVVQIYHTQVEIRKSTWISRDIHRDFSGPLLHDYSFAGAHISTWI